MNNERELDWSRRLMLKAGAYSTLVGLAGCAGPLNNSESSSVISFASRGTSSRSGNGIHAELPRIDLESPTAIQSDWSFTITNTETDDQVTVSPTEATDAEVSTISFLIYGPEGNLRTDNAKLDAATSEELIRVPAEVNGDTDTFTQQTVATYQITGQITGLDGEAETGQHPIPVGYPTQFQSSISDDTVKYSFNAEQLPSDGQLNGFIRNSEGGSRIEAETEYNAETTRFVARVNADDVPAGDYIARLLVSDPESGATIIGFRGTLSIN